MKTYFVEWAHVPTNYSPLLTSAMTAGDLYMADEKYNKIGIRSDRRAVVESVYEESEDGSRTMHYENRHLALYNRISEELKAAVLPVKTTWAKEAT